MAYGEHWEWRAFGEVSDRLRARILALPAVPPDPWRVEDCYLYTPRGTANVKLRAGELKLKRFIGRDGDLERWLEDPDEVFSFPLAPDVVAGTAAALGIALPTLPTPVADQSALLDVLRSSAAPVQVILVRKTRWLRALPMPGVLPDVLVELAEIATPQPIVSLALEHPQAEPVRRSRALLGLDTPSLTAMSYLDALACWAQGKTLTLQP
jgi:hypothetical protein